MARLATKMVRFMFGSRHSGGAVLIRRNIHSKFGHVVELGLRQALVFPLTQNSAFSHVKLV